MPKEIKYKLIPEKSILFYNAQMEKSLIALNEGRITNHEFYIYTTAQMRELFKDCTDVEDDSLDELKEAWHNSGSHPIYHEQQINRLQMQWPALYNAIIKLLS